jgi:predicted O-methyltransferase YrrM
MYSSFSIAIKYLDYLLRSANGRGHGIHSPFVFEFITRVMNDDTRYPEYEIAEDLRRKLLKDETVLTVEDLGAGSGIAGSQHRSVSSIARHAAKPPKYARLLFRMIKFYKPSLILELGSSLGITTSYLSLADTDAKVITMEGAIEIAEKAKQHFSLLGLKRTELVTGNFDNTLPALLSDLPAVDFAFIDGNHRQEPTERYFRQLLTRVNNDSVFVFDDIHWSREMEAAWKSIRENPAVTCSIDLFFIGIVFFRKECKEKQHFAIRF